MSVSFIFLSWKTSSHWPRFVRQLGWLCVFLRVYIKAFQHASDLDDTVEEKLLVGDRPKQSNDPENKLPLQERLAARKPQELQEVCSTWPIIVY